MMKRMESHKNMVISAEKINGVYVVKLFINGKIRNSFETVIESEAQEVYANSVYEMLGR